MIRWLAIGLMVLPQLALAFDPGLPDGARIVAQEERSRSAYDLPTGPFRNGALPSERVRGHLLLRAWRVDGRTDALIQIGEALTGQLTGQGFDIIFACETSDCGGFDFRFNTLVLPPPQMFVDLSDFRFIAARKETDKGVEAVGLLISRTSRAATVQVASVNPMDPVDMAVNAPSETETSLAASPQAVPGSLSDANEIGATLVNEGHITLPGLAFETGSSTLRNGDNSALAALSSWLLEDPKRRVALVGHTDSDGALEGNIKLSQSRANSVLRYLVVAFGVPESQLEAHGIGFLAPVASNATDTGRQANRRVEAVLITP